MIKIVNWERHQHYKRPKPPWIKVYRDTLNCYRFSRLALEQRYTLYSLWLLAAETDNEIPADPDWLQNRLGLEAPPDLQPLIAEGFVTCSREALEKLYTQTEERRDRGETEERQRRETTTEAPKVPAVTSSRSFVPPTEEEVESYCKTKSYQMDPEAFCDFYRAKNWMVGKNKMRDWQAAVRNWMRRKREQDGESSGPDPWGDLRV